MTPHPGPPRADASRLRCLLAALLLTVLTLLGGAATASGAPPAALTAGPGAAAADPVPSAPPTGRPGHPFRHRAGAERGPDAGHRTGPGRNAGPRAAAGQGPRKPDHAHAAAAGPDAAARAEHEHPRAAADPVQTPRAGSGRAYLLLHAPPPPHEALPPAAPGPTVPRGGVRLRAADTFSVPGCHRGALPGVRGPPGRTAGPTTGHPSCTADPASRPH
ncbi:hypothetical protein ACFV2V_12555 [Streptomyces sp. NPDC059698]|uniref:hypothetical protein n=1 Tax=unclassified Streptomyces TaxID=2593676 RepID=UPI00093CE170|nr:hypothetical protein [Streptomyces sp. CB02366]OKJ35308.1 hypothetical protein AMK24_19150 [Streptomyces sp. CB02366]